MAKHVEIIDETTDFALIENQSSGTTWEAADGTDRAHSPATAHPDCLDPGPAAPPGGGIRELLTAPLCEAIRHFAAFRKIAKTNGNAVGVWGR